jgi:putative glycerol-1-phosphate prenyltransferase
LDRKADGVLFLSLISGRNPDYLIGQHVLAAPFLKKSQLEILPTGYMLVGDDRTTTVAYVSNSLPIPTGKIQIAVSTAMAGEMLGLRLIYMDAGSGAKEPVPPGMIREVRNAVDVPVIVGGGLNTGKKIDKALKAGADIIVLGNSLEKDQKLLEEASALVKRYR